MPMFISALINTISDDQQALNGPEINEVNVVFVKYPDDCCPRLCIEKCSVLHIFEHTVLGQTYWKFRCHMFSLVENNYFETFIIIMILASSMALVGICIWPNFSSLYHAGWVTKTTHYDSCHYRRVQECNPFSLLGRRRLHSLVVCRIVWISRNEYLPSTASNWLTLLFSSGHSAPRNEKSISCAEKPPGA